MVCFGFEPRMVGADESSELVRHPKKSPFFAANEKLD